MSHISNNYDSLLADAIIALADGLVTSDTIRVDWSTEGILRASSTFAHALTSADKPALLSAISAFASEREGFPTQRVYVGLTAAGVLAREADLVWDPTYVNTDGLVYGV